MHRKFRITVDGRPHDVIVEELTYPSSVPYPTREAAPIPPSTPQSAPISRANRHGPADANAVVCTLGGMVESVVVIPGQEIGAGDTVVVIEAMKMKTPIVAHRAGKVGSILVKAGESVETGQVLVELSPA